MLTDPQFDRDPPRRAIFRLALGFGAGCLAWNLLPYDPTERLPVLAADLPAATAGQTSPDPRTPDQRTALRIVTVGASLVVGYPYSPLGEASFASLLGPGLNEVYGTPKIHSRAVGAPALDSPAIAALCAQVLLDDPPDILIVSLGGNEFGSRIFGGEPLAPTTWLETLGDRTTRARRLLALTLGTPPSPVVTGVAEQLFEPLYAQLFDARPGQPVIQGLPVSRADRELLAARVTRSMRDIADRAKGTRTRIVFCTAPYNLTGSWPVCMPRHLPAIDTLVLAARRPGNRGVGVDRSELDRLLTRHPERADLHFLAGRLALATADGLPEPFERARDLDPAPLHLEGTVFAAIELAASDLTAGGLLDLNDFSSGASSSRERRFLDFTHLTLQGHIDLAVAVTTELERRQLVPRLRNGWQAIFRRALDRRLESTITPDSIRDAPGQTARSAVLFHALCGNVRDALTSLPTALDGLRGELTAANSGPQDPAWAQWVTIAGFLAHAQAHQIEEFFAGDQAQRTANLVALSVEFWGLDADQMAQRLDAVAR